MSVGRLLACTLMLMCRTTLGDTSELTTQNAPLVQGHHVEQCQYEEFISRREHCRKNYNFLSSRSGEHCHIMQVYVDCLTTALRNTGCTTNPFFLTWEAKRVSAKIREKRLICNIHSELLQLEGDSQDSCLRVRAVKLFFKCGTAFHFHAEGKSLTSGTICELLKVYVNCGKVALEDTNCTTDEYLKANMNYFISTSSKRHAVLCPNVTNLNMTSPEEKRAVRLAPEVQQWASAYSEKEEMEKHQRLKGIPMRQVKECRVEDALRRYFTCGSNFLWKMVVWKRHFAKHQHINNLSTNQTEPPTPSMKAVARMASENEEVCRAIKELQECTNEIITSGDCKNLGGLSTKMVVMQEMLIGDSSRSACQFMPKTKQGIYPAYSKQNLPPPGCSYRKLVKLFAYCVVNFFSSFAVSKDPKQACMFLSRHDSCVKQARMSTNCSMKVKELDDFVYLTSVVQDKYSAQCKKEEKDTLAEKKAEAGVPILCKRKTLLQKYLKCSLTFQNKLSNKGDECRSLATFSQCLVEAREDTECTFTDDAFNSMLHMQTELMTDSIRSHCTQQYADLNVLLTCAQPDALKKMLLCGLSYNKVMEDLKRQGEYYVTSTTCRYLAEYQHCMVDVERSTGCTKSTLHTHTSAILNFWTWNVTPLCESAASLLLNDVDSKCNYPKALSKSLQCTSEFQEYAEQATWDTMTSAESCSALEMLDKCLLHSLDVRDCSRSLSAKAQVSVLRSLLMSEYKVVCIKAYQSAPGFPEMRQEDYVYDDYYYFGDEVVRTRPPEKRPDHFIEQQVADKDKVAPSARLRIRDEFEKLFNKMRGLGLDKILRKVMPDPRTTADQASTPRAAAVNGTNSSEEYFIETPMTGAVIPVMDNDESLCNTAAYERETQRCSQYITEQAKKYKQNVKYIPVSNLRDVADNVCKMVDHYRACMSEVAERNKCLVMLARTPRIVENHLAKIGLTFCNSATIESGCPSRYTAAASTVALLCGLCLKLRN